MTLCLCVLIYLWLAVLSVAGVWFYGLFYGRIQGFGVLCIWYVYCLFLYSGFGFSVCHRFGFADTSVLLVIDFGFSNL